MDREADFRYRPGQYDYSIAWILLIFLGVFGVHRMYLGKWITGIIYLLTGGLFFIGWLYDLWTLNEQVSELNLATSHYAYARSYASFEQVIGRAVLPEIRMSPAIRQRTPGSKRGTR